MSYYEEYSAAQITLPRALLTHFSDLFSSADDFAVWLFLLENGDIAPSEIAEKSGKEVADVNRSIDRLQATKNLSVDPIGSPIFDAREAFKRLDQLTAATDSDETAHVGDLQQLTEAFEAEMGTISPIQMEEIRAWLDDDKFEPALIREALKEAVLNRKVSLNYIRAILRNWRNDGIVSLNDIEERRSARENNGKQTPDENFFIPVDGPWNQ